MERTISIERALGRLNAQEAETYKALARVTRRTRVTASLVGMAVDSANAEIPAWSKGVSINFDSFKIAYVRSGRKGPFSPFKCPAEDSVKVAARDDEEALRHAVRFNQDTLSFLCEWSRMETEGLALLVVSDCMQRHAGHLERLNLLLDALRGKRPSFVASGAAIRASEPDDETLVTATPNRVRACFAQVG